MWVSSHWCHVYCLLLVRSGAGKEASQPSALAADKRQQSRRRESASREMHPAALSRSRLASSDLSEAAAGDPIDTCISVCFWPQKVGKQDDKLTGQIEKAHKGGRLRARLTARREKRVSPVSQPRRHLSWHLLASEARLRESVRTDGSVERDTRFRRRV